MATEAADESILREEEVSDELFARIIGRMYEMLAEADLNVLTERKLRQKLEVEFGIALQQRKKELKQEIEKYLTNGGSSGEATVGTKRKTTEPIVDQPPATFVDESNLSIELQDLLNAGGQVVRKDVVSKLWAYIKDNNLQDPKDRRKILLNDAMRRVFVEPLDSFSLQKQLTFHMRSSSDGSKSKAKKAKTDKDSKAKADGKQKVKGKERESSALSQLQDLSPVLQEFMGMQKATRADITKFMWGYFKANGLQNPENKREIICDDKLQNLLGLERFEAFNIQKYLKTHIGAGIVKQL